jgi:hypothetical protein
MTLEDLSKEFSNNKWVGVCITWGNGKRVVKIDKDHWEGIYDSQRLQLVYHELGHCVLNRPHFDQHGEIAEDLEALVPLSIMRSYAFDILESVIFMEYLEYYEKELLQR